MTLSFTFGKPGSNAEGEIGIGIPFLGGEPMETVLTGGEPAGNKGGVALWRAGADVVGAIRAVAGEDTEEVTARLYSAGLRALGSLNLHRIWNFVPRINAGGKGGLENYRAFCRGRSLAFESAFGAGFARSLPASTAVGTAGSELIVVFLAGELPGRHFENPAQVPAYNYPPEHGPRSPSFARATVVDRAGGPDVFISGTSAIVGHATVAPGDTLAQLDCTFDNLRRISAACGLGDHLGSGRLRHFKVYLRNASDLRAVTQQLDRRMLAPGDRVNYLGADICRAELNVEIEVVVRGAERS